jgi:hypothetical protein
MDAERLFWLTNEYIKEQLAEMSDADLIDIEKTLPEEGVFTFDINELLEMELD